MKIGILSNRERYLLKNFHGDADLEKDVSKL